MSESTFQFNAPLIVRSPNWLGDAVMALPAVRNLKTKLGSAPLTVATPEKLAALWRACPFVDSVFVLEQPKSLWHSARQLRAAKFGSAVLLPNSLRSAAETWLAGIPQRAGYARGSRGMFLTTTIPEPVRNPIRLHQRYFYLDLVTALGGPDDDAMPALKREAPPKDARPVLALCPGAEYGPAKRWPIESFLAVARHFLKEHQARIVLLGAPGDAALAESFTQAMPQVENRVGKTSLSEFIAALASARLVICNDSGAMHVASALGTPTVVMFGSTEPALTGPLGAKSEVLRHHVPCSPCFLRECPLDFACMTSLTPEMAIAAGERLWKG